MNLVVVCGGELLPAVDVVAVVVAVAVGVGAGVGAGSSSSSASNAAERLRRRRREGESRGRRKRGYSANRWLHSERGRGARACALRTPGQTARRHYKGKLKG